MNDDVIPIVALDANALDAKGAAAAAHLHHFQLLLAMGRFTVVVAGGVAGEIAHPNTPIAVQAALLASRPRLLEPSGTLTHAQKLDRIRVRAVLRGDTDGAKHEADAAHLSHAAEAGCAFFITHDKRILRRRSDLRRILVQFEIVTLERFVAILTNEDDGDRALDPFED